MKVLMVGAGRNIPTFIARQITTLENRGVEVDLLPELSAPHRWLKTKLCRIGITAHLPRDMKQKIQWADVVHFQWPGHYLTYGPVVRKYGKPVVLSLRGRQINIVPYLPGMHRYVRSLQSDLPKCDGYHCVSRHILEEARQFGLEASRARVITPAVDTSFFAPAESPSADHPFRIAMIGALMWRKDYETALLALRNLLDNGHDAILSIAGTGEDLERIEYTIQDLGLRHAVKLLGGLTPAEIRELLQSSHTLLLTSQSEGIPNVLLEAMSSGLPVVATEAGGVSEALQHGSAGFVIPIRDFRAASEHLERLAVSTELRKSMGANARARMVAEFDLRQQGDLFASLYDDVLAARSSRQ